MCLKKKPLFESTCINEKFRMQMSENKYGIQHRNQKSNYKIIETNVYEYLD